MMHCFTHADVIYAYKRNGSAEDSRRRLFYLYILAEDSAARRGTGQTLIFLFADQTSSILIMITIIIMYLSSMYTHWE